MRSGRRESPGDSEGLPGVLVGGTVEASRLVFPIRASSAGVRQFSAAYLRRTRAGMWEDSRAALSALDLGNRRRVLDVGCGTGELTAVLQEAVGRSDSTADEPLVVGVDADSELLSVAAERAPVVAGDALRLPFADDSFDLVVCQALLINLPDPAAAVEEFARVSSELVAVVEPDNGAVSVSSTVESESPVTARARAAYLAGVETDPTLGADAAELFRDGGLSDVSTRQYDHEQVVEPPYSDGELRAARRKASAASLADRRETLLSGPFSVAEYDTLRADWRTMGREVVAQIQEGAYRRREVVPFFVTVGRV